MENVMGRKARQFPIEFKETAARRLLAGESGTALSRELDVKRSVLYRWRDAYRAEGMGGLSRQRGRPGPTPAATEGARMLDQPPARFDQPLLQARQRPALDSLRQP